jgi:hypothetical protein
MEKNFMAVANGNRVDIYHPNGGRYSRIPITGKVVTTPAISGDRVSFVEEHPGGGRTLRIHKLSGPCLGKKSV